MRIAMRPETPPSVATLYVTTGWGNEYRTHVPLTTLNVLLEMVETTDWATAFRKLRIPLPLAPLGGTTRG